MEYAMLRSINELKGYIISASDGEIGPCMDFLFDDCTWVVRYTVARGFQMVAGRKVIDFARFFLMKLDLDRKENARLPHQEADQGIAAAG